jgi:hypothetical protein
MIVSRLVLGLLFTVVGLQSDLLVILYSKEAIDKV